MKSLPLVFLVVLTVATAVHGRAVRLRRSASYYANESDKDQKEGVSQDTKEVPASTTVASLSKVSETSEEVQEHAHAIKEEQTRNDSEEDHTQHQQPKEEEKAESGHVLVAEAKSEEVTSTKPSEEVDDKNDQEEEKPAEPAKTEEQDQRPSKRSELPTSVGLPQESSSAESISVTTEVSELSTRQDSDDSNRKLEAVTEPRKEGRSSSDKPQAEVTSPASEEPSSSSQEPEKASEDKVTPSVFPVSAQKVDSLSSQHSDSAVPSVEKRHSLEQHPEPSSESPNAENPPKQQPEQESSEEVSSKEVSASDAPSTESSSEKSKDEQVRVVVLSSTTQEDKQVTSESAVWLSAEKRENEEDQNQQESSSQHPVTESQEDQSSVAPSGSPAEEPKEVGKESPKEEEQPKQQPEQELSEPLKSSPSKRFADWVDHVPRGFQA